MADPITPPSKLKRLRKSPESKESDTSVPPSPPLPPGADWSKNPLALELAEDLASLCQEMYAFQLGTLGPDPQHVDVAALEKAGYVRGSMASPGLSAT